MKKNFTRTALVITTVFAMTMILYSHKSNQKLTDTQLANIEALAQDEYMQIECDNFSPIVKCKKMCIYCGAVWTTFLGYGNAGRLKGTCRCGVTYF